MKISKTSKPGSSAKRNGTTRKSEPRDLRKTLSSDLLAQAKSIADSYSVVLEPHPRLGFRGNSVEFPTVFVSAKTAEQCVRKTREALMVGVAVMLEAGQTPPLAACEEQRNHQINVRLTAEEKLLLESAARRRGFRGISDFVRTAALNQTRRAG